MASSRKLIKPVIPIEVLDRMVKEVGAEYSGPRVDLEAPPKLTKYQLRVYDFIRKNPGVWYAQLLRVFGSGGVYAVRKLERLGIVESRLEDNRRRYYVVGTHG
jgi:hypothetical protein